MHWKKASVQSTHTCPLCERDGRDFYKSSLVPLPICGYCADFLDMVCLEEERPNIPEVDRLEALVDLSWQEYRVALLRENLATWRKIEQDPSLEYIQTYMECSGWSEAQTRDYVRSVIRDLEASLRKAVGGELQ